MMYFFSFSSTHRKKYIVDNKDSAPCAIPTEIINNSILKDSMVEGRAPAPALLLLLYPSVFLPIFVEWM
jgi:hypothetical protein